VRFPAPVPVGSKLRATVTVAGAEYKPRGVEVVFTVSFEILGGGRPVCVADVVLLYR
jgi:acyl dehydratase